MNQLNPAVEICIVRDDLLFRLQRRIGLIPKDGLGLLRRAVFFALLAWLPIGIWALANGRLFQGQISEPFLSHFGIHARFLVAIPLIIFGEGVMQSIGLKSIPYFMASGLIRDDQQNAFSESIKKTLLLRDSTIPWVVIASLVCMSVLLQLPYQGIHELNWTNVGTPTDFKLGFGGLWMICVSRPIFFALVWITLWRLVLLFILLKRISALDLQFVPSHPDRAGGLGFLEKIPMAFSLFAFSISLVLASRLAHEAIYHGLQVESLKLLSGIFVAAMVFIFLSPLLVFIPKLSAAKRKAKLDYAALIGNHGRLVHRRWIQNEKIPDESLLQAPEIGPVADTLGLYEAVAKMRTLPIGKSSVLCIAIPSALPLVALFSIQIPVKDVLLKILTSII